MLEKTHTPAALLLGALAGVLAATLCILGSAAWMAKQGCSASMAWPLMSGGLFDTPALLRMAAVLLCSCAGGVLGRALGEKKRRI